MGHAIDNTLGFNAFAFRGQKAWHGLGTKLPEYASKEQWMTTAGVDFRVVLACLKAVYDGVEVEVDSHRATIRQDTRDVLGVVGADYNVVQPADVVDFFYDLFGNGRDQEWQIETLGALEKGKKVFCMAKYQGAADRDFGPLGKGDRVVARVLVATSFDGKLSTIVMPTTIRVVCKNTLGFAAGTNGERAFIRVPHSSQFDPDAYREKLAQLGDGFSAFRDRMTALSRRPMHDGQALRFFQLMAVSDKDLKRHGGEFKRLIDRPVDWTLMERKSAIVEQRENEDVVAKVLQTEPARGNLVQRLLKSYQEGPGAREARGSAFGVLQACTHYADHGRGAAATRQSASLFGTGAQFKERATRRLMELV